MPIRGAGSTLEREPMNRIQRLTATLATAFAVALTAPDPAFATFPAPDGPTTGVVEHVAVPVDDSGTELVQMAVAMAVGAALATGRRRRRRPPGPRAVRTSVA
jgi:MYXO-CTERM domain-containing protein